MQKILSSTLNFWAFLLVLVTNIEVIKTNTSFSTYAAWRIG